MPVDPVPKKISPLHTTEKRFSISVWKGRSMQEFTERSSSGYTSNRDSDPFCVFSSTSADTLHPHHSNAIPGCPPEASPFCRSNELCAWAWLFLRPGLCNTAAKYSKTYEQLIADALRIDAPASDMTFFIISRMREKTIGIICSMWEGWLTHYSSNWQNHCQQKKNLKNGGCRNMSHCERFHWNYSSFQLTSNWQHPSVFTMRRTDGFLFTVCTHWRWVISVKKITFVVLSARSKVHRWIQGVLWKNTPQTLGVKS